MAHNKFSIANWWFGDKQVNYVFMKNAVVSQRALTTTSQSHLFHILLALILFAVPFGAVARADRVDSESRPWVEAVRKAVRADQAVFEAVDPVSNLVAAQVRIRLEEISFDQAQIWADTILGGEYLAEPEVLVDAIEIIRAGELFLGYRITYSSAAYETMDCDASRQLKDCVAGRIVESSFVSPNLESWIRDDRHYAEFFPSAEFFTK